MNPYNLELSQLQFELKRIGLETDGELNILAQRLALGMLLGNPVKAVQVDEEEEQAYCRSLLDTLKVDAAAIKAKTRTARVVKVETRILHVINRLENVKLLKPDLTDPQKMIDEAREITKGIEACLLVRQLPDPSEGETSDADNTNKKDRKGPSKENQGNPDPSRKYVPIYKWGIKKFDGASQEGALDFLRRVEEMSKSRGVKSDALFEESADLFEGKALIWHREAIQRVSSWSQLKREFKIAFRVHAADGYLRDQIRSTKQGEDESIDLFLSIMADKYDRLERQLPEQDRLEEILKNLNSFLKDQLYTQQINSIDELRRAARQAEAGRLRMSGVAPKRNSETRMHGIQGVSAVENAAKRDAAGPQRREGREFLCFNCHKRGHGFRDCQEEKKTFCFRCGREGRTAWNCDRCNNNEKN
uniref:Gag polyprotein n=1 Tax=Lygus hesperus TaxID=30085 RepID=A0A0A9XV44_LYGHE